ncbi:unnamed protein product [Linum trigynum]|uniref:AAA+ ATPase domain-containing protein n=1 Tax=Linum trigynum TaxID=586398 RepID=A0AAV2CA53_9ROSI
MADFRVADLHLRKELTQIRKASRVLRDPGTSSSWKKSPLPLPSSSASRSATAAAPPSSDSHNAAAAAEPISDRPVFLYNWKSSNHKALNADGDEGDYFYGESCSLQEQSIDGSLTGEDSRSDTIAFSSSAASKILRCRDAAALASPSINKRAAPNKKQRGKKFGATRSDVLSRYSHHNHKPHLNLTPLLRNHHSLALALGSRDGTSVDHSDATTEDYGYARSEDLRKLPSSASPLLLKLRNKNWARSPATFLKKGSQKEESFCSYNTPALSTSSYNRYYNRNASTVGSWDATTNDGVDDEEDEENLDLPGGHGCGIPCYWSRRTPRHSRGSCGGSCCSPSLSDTLRRKGSRILCGGSQSIGHRSRRSLSVSNKRRMGSRSAQGVLPLLAGGRGGSSIGTACSASDDELSTANYGELDLEALSRLDGRRWSNCRSAEGLEIVPVNGGDLEGETSPESIRSLSHKYNPVFFSELIGQNIVVQSLTNAVSRGRIAPVYLFQGPRGTGKTSAARIFSTALNCTSTGVTKPCGHCSSCADFVSGNSRFMWEFDGTSKQCADKMRYLLKMVSQARQLSSSHYQVFLVDECHLLPSKLWLAFLKFLEEPHRRVVFIFITTDPDNVPRTVQSRCQKYQFNKIKDADIVSRLRKISSEENLDVESDALDLIAMNADGSLRDAETMLEQLSLLGKKITTSLVNELVGVVSDEKLLELLELALLSDTAETVKRARDLMDSGIDPMVLMSQLASLIMDIIAGIGNAGDARSSNSFFGGRNLTEAEVERLKNALKILSDAEKQLRFSSDRSTWFTATLLQLGSVPSLELTISSSSKRGSSSRTTEEDPSSASREASVYKRKSDAQYLQRRSSSPASLYDAMNGSSFGLNCKSPHSQLMGTCSSSLSLDGSMSGDTPSRLRDSEKLDFIWEKCIEKCHSKTLRQLLHSHGKLLSIAEVEGVLVVYIAFIDREIKARAERFMSSITNSIEMVLRRNVDVKIILVSDANFLVNGSHQSEPKREGGRSNPLNGHVERSGQESKLKGGAAGDHSKLSQELLPQADGSDMKETGAGIPMQRIESIIREQRLETAWLQTVEKGGTPGTISRLKPEKNQVLPQEGIYHHQESHMETSKSTTGLSPHQWEDELNQELKVLKMQEPKEVLIKDQLGRRAGHTPMSPSMLHNNDITNFSNKESLFSGGYESSTAGGGCSGLFCWNAQKSHKRKENVATVRSRRRVGGFSLFGECGKQKKSESRFRRR